MTKRGACIIALPVGNRTRDRDEDLLDEVLGIRVLEASSSGDSVDHRSVNRRELIPRIPVIAVFQAEDQAVAGFWNLSHGGLLERQNTPHRTFLHPFDQKFLHNVGQIVFHAARCRPGSHPGGPSHLDVAINSLLRVPDLPLGSTKMRSHRIPAPALLLAGWATAVASVQAAEPLAGTQLLQERRPLDEVMVEGIDRFALREINQARANRESRWQLDYSSPEKYEISLAPYRERFAQLIGAVDKRVKAAGIEFVASTEASSLVAENAQLRIDSVRWPALDGVYAEGLLLRPKRAPLARVVAIPDADWTPEMIAGLEDCDTTFARDLAAFGCEVLVPTLISRGTQYSKNESIGRTTDLSHREFIYRQAFELGRHVIGYEVQKILAAVDQLELRNRKEGDLPIAVVGVSEGGLLALYSGALDNRIDGVAVSGYFDQRENVWQEPIYRNVWGLLTEFGDAQLAGMIAPRFLYLEHSPAIPEHPLARRSAAAPGAIARPDPKSVWLETKLAGRRWAHMNHWPKDRVETLNSSPSGEDGRAPLDSEKAWNFVVHLAGRTPAKKFQPDEIGPDERSGFSTGERQREQVEELQRYTQRLLQLCHLEREKHFSRMDRTSARAWEESSHSVRQMVYDRLIGRLPDPSIDPNPRSRKVIEDEAYDGYEVVLDVYPDVIAAGILLVPTNLKNDERRPVVVTQHGLEGTPMDTISGPESKGYRAYKSFSEELVRRGFIVYAPQNPYRGRDAFRTLQRKSNPLSRSLFSYIIPQHLVTLRWLTTLPYVDPDRIAFYGLSYGGKTAMRVPPMLPPTEQEPGYCLSICSADFNEWVAKNASTDARFSYVWTGEYEIFEWNMGHIANYAELAMLMTPRPFMVERGHDDGVGIDEWVAWEFAKVRRHYNKLGLGDRAEIEFFDGPHTIHGKGTYRFLHHHLEWP